MVPEEWPIADPLHRAVRPARHAGRGRLGVVRQDFFLDPAKRLTEQERALMTAMLADLIGGIADELRAALPGGGAAANDEDGHQLLLQLGGAGLLDEPALIALLLRRADEERLAAAMRARSPGHAAFLQALVGDADGGVAAAAMALILARGARRDRLGQPRIQYDDLPADVAEALTYRLAAALRLRLAPALGADQADRQLAAAAQTLLDRRDGAKALGSLCGALVETLYGVGKLDEDLLAAAADEGDLGFVAEALARSAGIRTDDAWDHLIDGGGGRLMLLLRMASTSRQLAARLLGLVGDLIGIDDPGAEIGRFDTIGEQEAEQARVLMRLDPAYHDAVDALETYRG